MRTWRPPRGSSANLRLGGGSRSSGSGSGHLFRDVSHESILRFVRDYQNDELSYLTQTDPVARYIESRADGPLERWDVLFVGLAEASAENPEFNESRSRDRPADTRRRQTNRA